MRCAEFLAPTGWEEQGVDGGGSVDDVARAVAEPSAAGAGVAAKQGDCLCQVEPAAFGEDPVGRLGDHPGVQRGLRQSGPQRASDAPHRPLRSGWARARRGW
jgi:hypothetical protein